MIRAAQPHDLPVLSALWLDTNLEAHAFIDAAYFTDRLSLVTMALTRAEIYICTDTDSLIRGFIGLNGDEVAGLFVRQGCRGAGVGKALLDKAQSLRTRLTLSVYDLNPRALQFYVREGFKSVRHGYDEDSHAYFTELTWKR